MADLISSCLEIPFLSHDSAYARLEPLSERVTLCAGLWKTSGMAAESLRAEVILKNVQWQIRHGALPIGQSAL